MTPILLSVPHAQILIEIEGEKYLQYPPSIKAPSRSHDKKKYYRFHRDHDHDTEQCIQLKNEIEVLIR